MGDAEKNLPLEGIKVLAFTHAVMGPAAGLVLADLGADVIHIEPTTGDTTRRLKGFGVGYFPFFNRNKKSLAVDLKAPEGREIILKLVDVIVGLRVTHEEEERGLDLSMHDETGYSL